MKLEKGKLYYDTIRKEVFLAPNEAKFIGSSFITNKIAVNCPEGIDKEYVANEYDLSTIDKYSSDYVLINEDDACGDDWSGLKRYNIITIEQFKEFYHERTQEMKTKKVYTESTPLLIEMWKDYKGKKSGDGMNSAHFDNTDVNMDTGNFHADRSSNVEEYYKNNNYIHLSEQEFIEFMDLQPTTQGYKESIDKLDYELDFEFITQMAERMASNKGKYEPFNWQKPMDVDKLKQSLMRHVIEVMKGNYNDDGRDMGHIEAIAANAMMINYQIKNNG